MAVLFAPAMHTRDDKQTRRWISLLISYGRAGRPNYASLVTGAFNYIQNIHNQIARCIIACIFHN